MRILSTCASVLSVLIVGLAGPAAAQAGFVPALGSPFPYAAPTVALAVGDSDRNGTVDVVAGGLSLRRNAGTGFLGGPIAVGTTGPVEALATGDLDGDGLRDYAAIVPGAAPDEPRRLLRFIAVAGNGFAAETVLDDVGQATSVAIGDVDNDTLADLVVVRTDDADPEGEPDADPPVEPVEPPAEPPEPGLQDVTVVRGGTLTPIHFESGIDAPSDVELADLDGNGRLEIVVAGNRSSVAVLVNQGGAVFADGVPRPTGAAGAARRVALADLNGDGRPDLLATDTGAAAVVAALGDGAAGFVPVGAHASGLPGAAGSVAAGDVNGDGAVDAVAGGNGLFAVLHGNGGGGFGAAPGSPFASGDPAGGPVADVVAADMNRDGQLDVVTANLNGSVSVQLNDETGLLTATPTGVDFGEILPAVGVLTQTVTLRAARGALRLTRLDRQGTRNFSVADVDCLGRRLTLGQACTVAVSFNVPRRAKRYEALLSVDANAAATVVPLSATPRPPIVRRPLLKRKRVRRGQRLDLRYGLSEAALTRATVERARPGRRVGRGRGARRCVPARRGNLKRPRCTLWHRVKMSSERGSAGRNRMRIPTRAAPRGVGRKRRPGPTYPVGAYRLAVSAVDRFRNRSADQRLRFKVLRPRASKRRR